MNFNFYKNGPAHSAQQPRTHYTLCYTVRTCWQSARDIQYAKRLCRVLCADGRGQFRKNRSSIFWQKTKLPFLRKCTCPPAHGARPTSSHGMLRCTVRELAESRRHAVCESRQRSVLCRWPRSISDKIEVHFFPRKSSFNYSETDLCSLDTASHCHTPSARFALQCVCCDRQHAACNTQSGSAGFFV